MSIDIQVSNWSCQDILVGETCNPGIEEIDYIYDDIGHINLGNLKLDRGILNVQTEEDIVGFEHEDVTSPESSENEESDEDSAVEDTPKKSVILKAATKFVAKQTLKEMMSKIPSHLRRFTTGSDSEEDSDSSDDSSDDEEGRELKSWERHLDYKTKTFEKMENVKKVSKVYNYLKKIKRTIPVLFRKRRTRYSRFSPV